MSRRWKPIVACLSLILLANALGCNRGADGNKAQPAAINGSGSETPSEAGLQPPPPPKPTLDSQPPLVAIETSLGKITVELDRAKADLTVDNFLRYVGESFYDQTIVHQVYKGQAVLAGSYGKDMRSIAKSRHISVRNQADNGLKNVCGTIAMMRPANDVHGATSQFFINVADNPSLDYKDRSTTDGYGYCVFGKVVEGMDVVKAINGLDVRDTPEIEQTPKQQVVITSIRRIR